MFDMAAVGVALKDSPQMKRMEAGATVDTYTNRLADQMFEDRLNGRNGEQLLTGVVLENDKRTA